MKDLSQRLEKRESFVHMFDLNRILRTVQTTDQSNIWFAGRSVCFYNFYGRLDFLSSFKVKVVNLDLNSRVFSSHFSVKKQLNFIDLSHCY